LRLHFLSRTEFIRTTPAPNVVTVPPRLDFVTTNSLFSMRCYNTHTQNKQTISKKRNRTNPETSTTARPRENDRGFFFFKVKDSVSVLKLVRDTVQFETQLIMPRLREIRIGGPWLQNFEFWHLPIHEHEIGTLRSILQPSAVCAKDSTIPHTAQSK